MLTAFTDIVTETVSTGEPVALSGFCKFARRDSPARMGRNPATGETIRISARRRVRITPLKAFKDAVLSGKAPAKKAPARKHDRAQTSGEEGTGQEGRGAQAGRQEDDRAEARGEEDHRSQDGAARRRPRASPRRRRPRPARPRRVADGTRTSSRGRAGPTHDRTRPPARLTTRSRLPVRESESECG